MAIDISEEFHRNAIRSNVHLRILAKIHPQIERIRFQLRKRFPQKTNDQGIVCHINDEFDNASSHFQEKGWAFVENVFDEKFHNVIKENWPKRRYLKSINNVHKTYDRGYIYDENHSEFEKFPSLINLMKYFKSDDFSNRLTKFSGSKKQLHSKGGMSLTTTYPGSFVVPHHDTSYSKKEPEVHLNIIFFINGSGGDLSGGLTISEDNNMEEIVFEPKKLVNTCLVYDVKASFYHGFRPVKFGKFRHAVIINFQSKG